MRWGVYGAAGVLFVIRESGAPFVMLQKRSAMAHEGGSWSCAGGALDEGESPYDGAIREASEEVGDVPADHAVLGEYLFAPAHDWTYTTVVIEVTDRFGSSINFETDAVDWVHVDEVDDRFLHAGFAAAWPHLRTIIETPDTRHLTPGT